MTTRPRLEPEPEPEWGFEPFGADDQVVDLAGLEGARRRSGIWSEIDTRVCGSAFSICSTCPGGPCATEHCPVKKTRAARALREAEERERALRRRGLTLFPRRRGLLERLTDATRGDTT